MGYTLIWIESVAAALLLVALLTACTARWQRWVGRFVVPGAVVGILIFVVGVFTIGVGVLQSTGAVTTRLFIYVLSWTLVVFLGWMVILLRGLRKPAAELLPVAAGWPLGRLAIALGVVVILDCITFSNIDLAIKTQLAALRAESGARILMLMPPRVPDRENAALLYQEAFQELPIPTQLKSPWKEKAQAWFDLSTQFDFQDKDLHEFLRSQERVLGLLRQAAARPGSCFEYDYFQSEDLPLEQLGKLRQAAALLALDARSKARRGDPGARDDTVALFRLARPGHPPLVSFLTACAIEKIAVVVLEDVLAHLTPRPRDWDQASLEDVSFGRELRRALQLEEVALGYPFFLAAVNTDGLGQSLSVEEIEGSSRRSNRTSLDSAFYRVLFLPDDLATYRQQMQIYQNLAGRPYAQSREEWKKVGAGIRTNLGGVLAKLILPAAEKSAESAAKADAHHRLAQLALACEKKSTASKGKFPDRLEELIPDYLPRLPLDPFTDEPLRLKKDGKDLLLYSVGPDGEDNGGTPWNEQERRGDLVFRLRGRL